MCIIRVDINDIIVTTNRVWFLERDVQCICEAENQKFLVAQDQLTTICLIDTKSDIAKAVKEFKLKQNYTNGAISDIIKIPQFTKERPIVVVRSEGALFLFNLRTRGYTKLASATSLDCNTRQLYLIEVSGRGWGVLFARVEQDSVTKKFLTEICFCSLAEL